MRSFGIVMLVGCGLIGALAYLRRHEETPTIWAASGIGVTLFLWSLVSPTTIEPIYRAWMALGRGLGTVSSTILLGIVYCFVVTPVGLAMRWFGSDPLDRRRTSGSGWRERQRPSQRSDYEHMA